MRCTVDTGSLLGNDPVCTAEASHAVEYWNGSIGPMVQIVCTAHVGPTEGRVFPGRVSTTTL